MVQESSVNMVFISEEIDKEALATAPHGTIYVGSRGDNTDQVCSLAEGTGHYKCASTLLGKFVSVYIENGSPLALCAIKAWSEPEIGHLGTATNDIAGSINNSWLTYTTA